MDFYPGVLATWNELKRFLTGKVFVKYFPFQIGFFPYKIVHPPQDMKLRKKNSDAEKHNHWK